MKTMIGAMAAVAMATPAGAATLIEFGSSSSGVDRFDPALGTLTGVTISATFDGRVYRRITPDNGGTSVVRATGDFTWAPSSALPSHKTPFDQQFAINFPTTIGVQVTDTAQWSIAFADLKYYTGKGTTLSLLNAYANITINKVSGADVAVTSSMFDPPVKYASYKVTYDYTPAGMGPGRGGVPEPATWIMMIGGFALAGAALRRRRGKARALLA